MLQSVSLDLNGMAIWQQAAQQGKPLYQLSLNAHVRRMVVECGLREPTVSPRVALLGCRVSRVKHVLQLMGIGQYS